MLANLYLHWFDRGFQRGPAVWKDAKLVRYADDFLVMTRQWDEDLQSWIEKSLGGKFQLTINREKTKVVDLREEKAKVNFLGYTFQNVQDFARAGEAISEHGSLGEGDEEGTGKPAPANQPPAVP